MRNRPLGRSRCAAATGLRPTSRFAWFGLHANVIAHHEAGNVVLALHERRSVIGPREKWTYGSSFERRYAAAMLSLDGTELRLTES